MSAGSVDTVKALRERTGAGIMDCKTALKDSNGDIEKAVDYLRKKGMASAAKRAGREAKEGIILARVDGQKAILVEANCETDFVARNDEFKALADLAAAETLTQGEKAASSEKISQRVAELTGKIGEKILVRRSQLISSADGALYSYTHSNNKLGVIVELGFAKGAPPAEGGSASGGKGNAALDELGKNLAMQVAASNPLCLKREEVPAAALEREKAIFREEVKGKPDNIVDKIIQGKLEKFYQGNCLIEQPFIKDDKQSIRQLLEQVSKTIGDTVQIRRFVRYQLGETLAS